MISHKMDVYRLFQAEIPHMCRSILNGTIHPVWRVHDKQSLTIVAFTRATGTFWALTDFHIHKLHTDKFYYFAENGCMPYLYGPWPTLFGPIRNFIDPIRPAYGPMPTRYGPITTRGILFAPPPGGGPQLMTH